MNRRCRGWLGAVALVAAGWCGATPTVAQQGQVWVLENARLRVVVDPGPGRIAVRDLVSGYEWRQPPPPGGESESVVPWQCATPPTVDGDLAEWPADGARFAIDSHQVTDAKAVDNDADCSAQGRLAWDAAGLYIGVQVTDATPVFGSADDPKWWERDSLEFWVNGLQVGLVLDPATPLARTVTAPLADVRVACRARPDGYTVEAAAPWSALGLGEAPAVGASLRFALGVNDADGPEGRQGQIYFPRGWQHSTPATFAVAALADTAGQRPAAPAAASAAFRNPQPAPAPLCGLVFEADFGVTQGRPNTLQVTLTLTGDAADLAVTAAVADPAMPVANVDFLEPLVLDTAQGVLVVADYGNGHLYPLDTQPFPRRWLGADRLDMPWVGVCDLEKGFGYALVIETSDDAVVRCPPVRVAGRELAAPQLTWVASKGAFAYPRRALYRFAATGGYVALAKAYREYATGQGLIVPLGKKLQANPNLRRLFGAPDVWGDASLAFARQAKAAGVERMLLHGRTTPADMAAINSLGYLTSEYDNYTDILPVAADQEPDSSHDRLPAAAALQADQTRMAAWLTWDGKTQYMKRCPALWAATADKVIPKVLAELPFLGRFIDVTTAEGLYECYDAEHPLTRAQKRECGVALLAAVRGRGLVVGGEHGIWWGVPQQDYIEGMMSGGYASWPAGHLIHPKAKDQSFAGPAGADSKLPTWEEYAKWGIGHEWRVPLWELVFHDCIVSTWYWGDASDWLLEAAPEVTARKDAFNILYGTIPLLWADREGSWHKDRRAFLRTYRNTCYLHQAVAGSEMVLHEFVTPDRAVQRTRFANGTTAVVNFGTESVTVRVGGHDYRLPANGFAVRGPGLEQALELVKGQPVTTIRRDGFCYSDADGVDVAVRELGPGRVCAQANAGNRALLVDPASAARDWDRGSTRVYRLGPEGERLAPIASRASPEGGFLLGPFTGPVALEFICGDAARRPDLCFTGTEIGVSPTPPRQGEAISVSVTVANAGGQRADHAMVGLYMDRVAPECRLAMLRRRLDPGESQVLTATLDTARFDGARRLLAVLDPLGTVPELCEANNRLVREVFVTPDDGRWQMKRTLQVEAGAVDRDADPVVVPVDLPDVDPDSVRLAACDGDGRPGDPLPVQFEPGPEGHGLVCFVLPGPLAAGRTARFVLLWNTRTGVASRMAAAPAAAWDAASRTVETATYRLRFQNGTPTELATRTAGQAGEPFVSSLVLSSQETGWVDEGGQVEAFEVRQAGPVRTVVYVRKKLAAEVVCEKTYSFYPACFDLDIAVSKPVGGLYSRAYYLRQAQYTNSAGARATVDGEGGGEDVYGKGEGLTWYAVQGDDWAHSCLAGSPMVHVAYWDAGNWGGIGFVTQATKDIRMRYVVHAGAPAEGFAARDWARYSTPPKANLE